MNPDCLEETIQLEWELQKLSNGMRASQMMTEIINPINYAMVDIFKETKQKTFEEELEERMKEYYEEWLDRNCLI